MVLTLCLLKEPLRAEKFPCDGARFLAFDRDFFVQIAQARKIELRENGGENIANFRIAREGCFPYHGCWRIDRLGTAGIFESMKVEGFKRAVGGIGHRGIDARNSVRRRFHRGRGFPARENEQLRASSRKL